MNTLQEILTEALNNSFSFFEKEPIIRQYSGRAMYGKKCLAITGRASDLTQLLVKAARVISSEIYDCGLEHGEDEDFNKELDDKYEESQELLGNLLEYKSDSLGLDMVYYWPNHEYTEPEDEEFEDDEENLE